MAWVNFEKYVLKMADFQQILGANEQIFQIFGKQNADFWAKKYGNTADCAQEVRVRNGRIEVIEPFSRFRRSLRFILRFLSLDISFESSDKSRNISGARGTVAHHIIGTGPISPNFNHQLWIQARIQQKYFGCERDGSKHF